MTQPFSRIAQQSPAMSSLLDGLPMIASLDVPVLLQGATGTGKGLLAEEIHRASPRCAAPLLVINCAALSQEKVQEQLFGEYRDGQWMPGYLQSAEGGSLLLDEVAELPYSAQAALLRFIEQGELQAVGSAELQRVDVRILAASNADMLEKVRSGSFRADLYHRLNVVPVSLPELHQRSADLKVLLRDLTAQAALEFAVTAPKFSAAAIAVLQRYSWPGNVRELKNLCQRMTLLLPGRVIESANLPKELTKKAQPIRLGAMDLVGKEVALIQDALEQAKGNKSRAARLLGISRDTLNYRLRKYELV